VYIENMDSVKDKVYVISMGVKSNFDSLDKIFVELITFIILAVAVTKLVDPLIGGLTGYSILNLRKVSGMTNKVGLLWQGVNPSMGVRTDLGSREGFLSLPDGGPNRSEMSAEEMVAKSAGASYLSSSGFSSKRANMNNPNNNATSTGALGIMAMNDQQLSKAAYGI
jgi:hypothetical protein